MKKKTAKADKTAEKSTPKREAKPKAEETAPAEKPETVLVLRTCDKDGKSHGGFQWPLEIGAEASAPDWDPKPKCGNGLHGLVDGEGDWNLLDWSIDAKAIIVETEKGGIVELGGKVKFRSGIVRQIGSLAKFACDLFCRKEKIVALVEEISNSAKNASSGDYATNASSGDYAKNASSGDYAKNASSGHSAKNASSGYCATNASSGHSAKNASSGDYATNASSGHSAKNASSGYCAKNASSGHSAKNASSGHSATNEAAGRDSVCVSAGLNSMAKAGVGGAICLTFHDGSRVRFAIGYVGEDGIKPDTWYRAENGKLVGVEA